MHTTLAGLEVEVFQATQQPPTAAVILCHGYGASGTDLAGLGAELVRNTPSLERVRFYSPAGLISLGDMGYGDAHAWWPIDMAALQATQRDPEAQRKFRQIEPPGLPAARKAILGLVDEVTKHTKLPTKKVVLGGFSQGAMLTTDVALRLEEAPAGLVVLSGTLLTEEVWRAKAVKRTALPVFQSHGQSDPVLPFAAAERLHALFVESGLKAQFHPFSGGHTIDAGTMLKLRGFLEQVLR